MIFPGAPLPEEVVVDLTPDVLSPGTPSSSTTNATDHCTGAGRDCGASKHTQRPTSKRTDGPKSNLHRRARSVTGYVDSSSINQ